MSINELERLTVKDGDIEKGKSHIIVDFMEYEDKTIVSKSIMKKVTGSINVLSFAGGKEFIQKISAFDTYAQIIEGGAIVEVDGKAGTLRNGEGIILLAHKLYCIKSNERCKLLLTVIKSGYE